MNQIIKVNYFGLLLFTLLVSWTTCDSEFQNSSHICDSCRCTSDEQQFVLDCSNHNYRAVLSNWPTHSKQLVAVLSHNNISTVRPFPYTNQTAKVLLDHCNIRILQPGLFANMPNVELVDLSYNLLTTEEIDGPDFKGPHDNTQYRPIALKYLNLAYNQIHSLPAKLFECTPHLEELNLEGNCFSILDINTQTALSTLTNLKRLNLANNKLTELVGDAVKNLKNLEELDLSSNHLDFVPEPLDYLRTSLKVLNLSNNYIYRLDDKSFLGLSLTTLYLNDLPRLRTVGPTTFALLPLLNKLEMCNNPNLREIDRSAFNPNQSLLELYLNNNSLIELPYSLLRWSTLNVFEVNENPLMCSCDLYNISQSLNGDITKNLDGPRCIDDRGSSRMVYRLKSTLCSPKYEFDINLADSHFQTLQVLIISLSAVLVIAMLVMTIIAVLRYRRQAACKNYYFTAPVRYQNPRYNPLNAQSFQ